MEENIATKTEFKSEYLRQFRTFTECMREQFMGKDKKRAYVALVLDAEDEREVSCMFEGHGDPADIAYLVSETMIRSKQFRAAVMAALVVNAIEHKLNKNSEK